MRRVVATATVVVAAVAAAAGWWLLTPQWSEAERAMIASLSLDALDPLPPDPSNAYGDNPDAAALGEALFFDTRLSSNGLIACSSCHLPDSQFQDDSPTARGVGHTTRRTMPIAGTAYSPWLFWDGRKDSQWSQALGPWESPVEHNGDRVGFAHLVAEAYRPQYEALFGPLPDLSGLPEHGAPNGTAERIAAWERLTDAQRDAVNRVFANMGKAVAAFERTLQPRRTRFDDFAAALASGRTVDSILSGEEVAGLRLFLGKGECTQCHNGPLLSDNHFHNTGVPEAPGQPRDMGRLPVLAELRNDPFNCLGRYSDAGPGDCAELRFMADGDALLRAFKSPSLRDAATRPPYMHAGQFATLAEVLEHYSRAPWAPFGVSELHPRNFTSDELQALEAFLGALAAPMLETPVVP